ncbi:MAG TPA: M12 family metallo-peptidase [Pirellulales bacterium]
MRRRNIICRSAVRSLSVIIVLSLATTAPAAEAVISNRTATEQDFRVTIAGSANQRPQMTSYKLASGDLTVVHLARGQSATLSLGGAEDPLAAARAYLFNAAPSTPAAADAAKASYQIQPDAAIFLWEPPTRKVELARIGIGDMPPNPAVEARHLALAKRAPAEDEAARTITVKILVDEEEPSRRSLWEKRLRDRVAAASEILDRYCGMKLKVIATDTWQSDNNITTFEDAVSEFVRKVDPGEARLAIGFTSQFQITQGRTHLGGTRGPLARHILLREWSQYVNEPERLELLVHEVGHFLGAVHSPESDSVMRVILGDKQARVKAFQIHYDPLNTLAMNMVADEWREHPPLHSIFEVSPDTRERLRLVYQAINQTLPTDNAAPQYIHIIEQLRGQAQGPQ